VEKIVSALAKVYADRNVELVLDLDETAIFYGDTGDLTEMLGNLLDNAFKWCRSRVRVTARAGAASAGARPPLEIGVEDDGPGIPAEMKSRVLQRGARADENTPGHGLGLAMVQDMVMLYRGTLSLSESSLGGLAVVVQF
jgi:two-component system sensor histidine kinase PhoQ